MTYSDQNRKNDFQWFLANYNDLYKQYGHKIIVIQNQTILGIYEDKNSAIDITTETHKLGTFIVQECNGEESGYTNYITSWEII